MSKRQSAMPSGLTFVELMVAATIFAMLLAGVSMHLHGVVTAWRRTTDTVEAMQRRHVALQRLAGELVNATVVDARPDAPASNRFHAEAMRFSTVAPGRDEAAGRQVRMVEYRLAETPQGSALVRTQETLSEVRVSPDSVQEPEVVLQGVSRFAVRYGYVPRESASLAWKSTWDDPAALPKLLDIQVEMDGPAGLPSVLRETILVPQGRIPVEPAG